MPDEGLPPALGGDGASSAATSLVEDVMRATTSPSSSAVGGAGSERVCAENLSAWNATVVLTNVAAQWAPLVLAMLFVCMSGLLAVRILANRLRARRRQEQQQQQQQDGGLPAGSPSKGAASKRPPLVKITSTAEPDHPYYERIDAARRQFLATHGGDTPVGKEREERLRSRFRSHDPRRWRMSPSRFGTGDGSAFEAPLRDWSSAELSLAHLEASSGLSVQRPPLAYSEEAARRGAEETGRDWFFSIADFEHALLHGTLEIKPTSRESSAESLKIELSESTSSLDLARESSDASLA